MKYNFNNSTITNTAEALQDLTQLIGMLCRHAFFCGASVTAEGSAGLLSAMATSRLCYIEDSGDGEAVSFANAAASFFGGGNTVACREGRITAEGLVFGGDASMALCDCIAGNVEPERVSITVLDCRAGSDLSAFIREAEGYLSAERADLRLSNGRESVSLPKNACFIAVFEKGRAFELLGEDARFFACPIYCDALNSLAADREKAGSASVLAEELLQLFSDAYLNYQPSEEFWRTVDSIDAFLKSISQGGIGNEFYIKAERYASVYNKCCGNVNSALDVLLAERLGMLCKELSEEARNGLRRFIMSLPMASELSQTAKACGFN